MFFHLLKYRFKIIIRDKELVFWTIFFPIILATLFNMAFSGLKEQEWFKPIKIAVIDNSYYQEDSYFKAALEAVSTGEDRIFDLEVFPEEEEANLKDKIIKNKLTGYIINKKMIVKGDGVNETILKSFLDQYEQKASTIENKIALHQGNIDVELLKSLMITNEYIQKVTYSKEDPNSSVNYFYTLIAMACFYAGFWGLKEVRDLQANQTSRAARINVSPISKIKILFSNLTADMTLNFSAILLLLSYLVFGLKIDFGMNMGYVLLTCFIGTLLGIVIGLFIGCLTKKSETMKTGALMTVIMLGSFLAGMMYIDMKYIIMTNIPLLGYINPCNVLTDALYSLYYFDTLTRFWLNIGILGIMIVVLFTLTCGMIRRQKYESI